MSMVYPDVDAIAFNSSPVTKAGTELATGNKRTSVWESGEILQAPIPVLTTRQGRIFAVSTPTRLHRALGTSLVLTLVVCEEHVVGGGQQFVIGNGRKIDPT